VLDVERSVAGLAAATADCSTYPLLGIGVDCTRLDETAASSSS